MRLEELTRLDICPFDQGVLSDILGGDETEKEEKAHFVLMLRYLALFAEQCQLPFSVPRLNVTLERQKPNNPYFIPFKKTKVAMMKQLFEEVMLRSGWGYGICGLEDGKTGDPELHTTEKDSITDWEQALDQVLGLLTPEKVEYPSVKLVVCWNRRIARYHDFAMSSPDAVQALFCEGDSLIMRILRKMGDPLAYGDIFCGMGHDLYAMAFFEGTDGNMTISLVDLDYNFFVQAMVLHMILESAETRFGYLTEGRTMDCEVKK